MKTITEYSMLSLQWIERSKVIVVTCCYWIYMFRDEDRKLMQSTLTEKWLVQQVFCWTRAAKVIAGFTGIDITENSSFRCND
jgi:hypothetical protein